MNPCKSLKGASGYFCNSNVHRPSKKWIFLQFMSAFVFVHTIPYSVWSSGKGVRCMKIERCIVMTLRKFSRLGNKLDIHHQTSHIQRTSIDSFFHLQVLCFITASETLLNSFLGNGTQCRRRAQQKHHIINTVRGDSWIL